MKNINDELLNKYLDDELSREEKDTLKIAIENSPDLKRKYAALLKTHDLLKNIEVNSPSINFTKMVMNKVNRSATNAKQQKYFLFAILSFFGLIALCITGYILFQMISTSRTSETNEIVTIYSRSIGDYFSSLFGKKNLTIFGSLLSFVMLVSGYFLIEFQKRSKKKFGH
jgi:hypothetical protein